MSKQEYSVLSIVLLQHWVLASHLLPVLEQKLLGLGQFCSQFLMVPRYFFLLYIRSIPFWATTIYCVQKWDMVTYPFVEKILVSFWDVFFVSNKIYWCCNPVVKKALVFYAFDHRHNLLELS